MKKSFLIFLITMLFFSLPEKGNAGTTVKWSGRDGISVPEAVSAMTKKKKHKKSKSKKDPESEMKAAIGGGLMLGLPMGDFGKAYKMGMGLDVEAEHFITASFSVGVSTGYSSFKIKEDSISTGSAKVTPILIKGNIYLSDGAFRPFIGLGIGMFYVHSKITIAIPTLYYNPVSGQQEQLNLITQFDDKETKPGIAPNVGFLYRVTDNLNLMFNAGYDMMFSKETMGIPKSLSFVGLNFGILYSF